VERVGHLVILSQSCYLQYFTNVFSFLGIIRTIRKHGFGDKGTSIDTETAAPMRKTKTDRDIEQPKWGGDDSEPVDSDLDEDVIDDTAELSKLTGKPHPDDLLLFAVPVCAPYQSLSQYTYRVKLTPGNLKRGKSLKQCLEILLKSPISISTVGTEKHIDLIKKVVDNDWIQTICPDVKISAAGASKAVKQQKASKKKSK
jgi:NFACT protein C-terminal domain